MALNVLFDDAFMNKRKFLVTLGCLPLALALPRESHAIWPILRFILGGTVRGTAAGAAARSGAGRAIINEVAKGAAQEIIVQSATAYLSGQRARMVDVEGMSVGGRPVMALNEAVLKLVQENGVNHIWLTDQPNEVGLTGRNPSHHRATEPVRIYIEDLPSNRRESQAKGGVLILDPYGEVSFTTHLLGVSAGLKRVTAETPRNPSIVIEPSEPIAVVSPGLVRFHDGSKGAGS